jgi:alpha-D-ribose 1-methylphosphonate 5-triphosphate synthase subunit PhnG
MDVERRASLLAQSARNDVIDLAERLIARHGTPETILLPEPGLVALEVREPVCRERFILGDVLVTRAEVVIAGAEGWAARMGLDREATFAAAVCAAVGDHGLLGADEVDELCLSTEENLADRESLEWNELAPTMVDFEEMD